jgi:hypothetical protein
MPLPALLSLLLADGTVLQGQAQRDCAPWDGPVFTLLTSPQGGRSRGRFGAPWRGGLEPRCG